MHPLTKRNDLVIADMHAANPSKAARSMLVRYKNTREVWFRCITHDHVYRQQFANWKRGKEGCNYCSIDEGGQPKNITVDQYMYKMKRSNSEKADRCEVLSLDGWQRVTFRCLTHGVTYSQRCDHWFVSEGCSSCQLQGNSLGEAYIANYLAAHDIEFYNDKSSPTTECLPALYVGSQQPCRYDFQLPGYNMVIEVHGEQHMGIEESFLPSFYKYPENEFEQIKVRDFSKLNHALDHGWHVLIIYRQGSYNRENIESIVGTVIGAREENRIPCLDRFDNAEYWF